MSQNLIVKMLTVEGMTCINCENKIERKLKDTNGITNAKVSYSTGKANVTYDNNIISLEEIDKIIENLDYKVIVANQNVPKEEKKSTQIIATIIIIFSLYTIIKHLGGFNIINVFPVAEEGMGFAMLFVIGLFTSIHCIAMCGGINLSQCVPQKQVEDTNKSKFSTLRPTFLYNLGRVISYTIVGGIVGAIGSVISFSGTAKGIVQLAAGIFMVIMGINMLNIFPGLRKFNPRMPKFLARKINKQKNSNSPLYVGLLNGLMPCGPLQAMQLYALSTGSPIEGALSMLFFSLGTVPLMFGLGAISSILSKKFTHKMMTVSAVLVVILGIFMFNNGMSLSGFAFSSTASTTQSGNVAQIVDGVQIVTTKLSSGGYEPITVQKGIPVKWTLQAEDGSINGCNNSIVIPKYNKEIDLEIGDNVIEFTPDESGSVPFSCWMGMIRSKITVVDDINQVAGVEDAASGNAVVGDAVVKDAAVGAETTDIGDEKQADVANSNSQVPYNIPTDEIAIAEIKDGIQRVKINVDDTRFTPAIVVLQSGMETEFIINATKVNESNSTLVFPIYNAKIDLVVGENTINLIAEGDFDFSTFDNGYSAYVKVVDDISKIDIEAIKNEVKEYVPTIIQGFSVDDTGLPSCH